MSLYFIDENQICIYHYSLSYGNDHDSNTGKGYGDGDSVGGGVGFGNGYGDLKGFGSGQGDCYEFGDGCGDHNGDGFTISPQLYQRQNYKAKE
jgi:hypothetical protein